MMDKLLLCESRDTSTWGVPSHTRQSLSKEKSTLCTQRECTISMRQWSQGLLPDASISWYIYTSVHLYGALHWLSAIVQGHLSQHTSALRAAVRFTATRRRRRKQLPLTLILEGKQEQTKILTGRPAFGICGRSVFLKWAVNH